MTQQLMRRMGTRLFVSALMLCCSRCSVSSAAAAGVQELEVNDPNDVQGLLTVIEVLRAPPPPAPAAPAPAPAPPAAAAAATPAPVTTAVPAN
jgi:hypothetical protein